MKDNNDVTIPKILTLLVITVLCILLLPTCSQEIENKKELNKTPNKVNVLWENRSLHSNQLADSIVSINPDKFVVNLEGPGSAYSPSTGPTYNDLVVFLQRMVDNGYTGKFVCRLETSKGDYESDWKGKGGLPSINEDSIPQDTWLVYVDYFNRIQDSLPFKLKFSEVMFEIENSWYCYDKTGKKICSEHTMFPLIRKAIKDSNVSLSTTSDWTIGWTYWEVDYYYAQMYDMCYIDTTSTILCGHNKYNPTIVSELINSLKQPMDKQKFMKGDSVYFIFTYSPIDTNKYGKIVSHSPMFGEMLGKDTSKQYIWTRKEFMEFNKMFKDSFPNQSNTGIWSYDDVYKNW
jgi:hypothetical protein